MKLYEVNQAIEEIVEGMVDTETGEIIGDFDDVADKLDSLQMERQKILEYVAKMLLNTRADKTALKEEESRLKERRERLSKKENRLLEILDRECGGEKTDLGIATVNYRKTSRVEISDTGKASEWLQSNKYTDCYRIPMPEISKTEVKKLLKNGMEVPGCELVEYCSCSVK